MGAVQPSTRLHGALAAKEVPGRGTPNGESPAPPWDPDTLELADEEVTRRLAEQAGTLRDLDSKAGVVGGFAAAPLRWRHRARLSPARCRGCARRASVARAADRREARGTGNGERGEHHQDQSPGAACCRSALSSSPSPAPPWPGRYGTRAGCHHRRRRGPRVVYDGVV